MRLGHSFMEHVTVYNGTILLHKFSPVLLKLTSWSCFALSFAARQHTTQLTNMELSLHEAPPRQTGAEHIHKTKILATTACSCLLYFYRGQCSMLVSTFPWCPFALYSLDSARLRKGRTAGKPETSTLVRSLRSRWEVFERKISYIHNQYSYCCRLVVAFSGLRRRWAD